MSWVPACIFLCFLSMGVVEAASFPSHPLCHGRPYPQTGSQAKCFCNLLSYVILSRYEKSHQCTHYAAFYKDRGLMAMLSQGIEEMAVRSGWFLLIPQYVLFWAPGMCKVSAYAQPHLAILSPTAPPAGWPLSQIHTRVDLHMHSHVCTGFFSRFIHAVTFPFLMFTIPRCSFYPLQWVVLRGSMTSQPSGLFCALSVHQQAKNLLLHPTQYKQGSLKAKLDKSLKDPCALSKIPSTLEHQMSQKTCEAC